jgi:tagatose 1,6-diphosphate aldolase/sulfofructosephosphate aldolase
VTAGLAPLADDRGVILGLAVDHRDSFEAVLRERGLDGLAPVEIQRQKAAVVGPLAPLATAVMLDHALGALAIADGACGHAALVMPLEQQGYGALGDERRVALMPDFSPARARDLGAAACKLLLPMRPDRPVLTEVQLEVAAAAVRSTHAVGLPLILEPLVYRRSDESEAAFRRGRADLVVEATRILAGAGGDLLKLPTVAEAGDDRPPNPAAYRRLADACRGLPWVLYGAGMPVDRLVEHLAAAGEAGASGFLVGRTIWADLLGRDPAETALAAGSGGRRRFELLAETATRHCHRHAAVTPGHRVELVSSRGEP